MSIEAPRDLAHTLRPRHLSMIALGGVIGAGLLVASSGAIVSAGPAVVLTYAGGGLLVVLVMRMLGEMASVSPETGSFSAYASRFIGPWAGTAVGWLYWWFWSVTVGIEATAAAVILSDWVPALPQWVCALALTVIFLGVNLVSVGSFGEFEFWFSSIKVGTIVAFLIVGILLIAQVIPNGTASAANLTGSDSGGFMPYGIGGVLAAFLPVMFSMFGAEVATIAAGESMHPREAVRKAVNSVVARILLFYIGSMLVIVTVLPWNRIEAGVSPFVTVLNAAGFGWAGTVMNVIVFTALLSTLNAALYSSSRMVFSLAERGAAPRRMARVSRRATPSLAILFSAIIGLVCVALNYAAPDAVFSFLVNSTGALVIVIWAAIAVSQLRSRRLLARQGIDAVAQEGVSRTWGYPVVNWIVIAALAGLLISMFFAGGQRLIEVTASAVVIALAVTVGGAVQRRGVRSDEEAAERRARL